MQIDNLVPFAFYQRLNHREKVLSLMVAGTVFLLGNLYALGGISRSLKTLRQDYADKRDEWEMARHFLEDKPTWDARAEWIRKSQERLVNRDSASYALLDQIQGLGRQYGVTITNPKIRPVVAGEKTSADYQAVTMEIDTRSDWGALLKFIHAVQEKPDKFLAFDEARLHTEQSDPSTIIGNFRVSRWYAPVGK